MRKRTILAWMLVIAAVSAHYQFDPWGFYWKIPQEEAAQRLKLIAAAEKWLGVMEADSSHLAVLDVYNTHGPLAQGYVVQPEDSWCAVFVSAAAIESGMTEQIPTECSCERQIGLLQKMGRWIEDDNAIPLPGDVIYYNWDQKLPGENSGWSDHVGIVVGTKWPFVKVIEGNYDDMVKYRVLLLGDIRIRGYGFPDFGQQIRAR